MLLNLLINARQAMPGGGRMAIKLAYDADSDMIDLVIRDNGCGIPPDKLPRIFDAFYTTKSGPDASGKGGTGLGLSDLPRHHRGPSRPHPRGQHGRQGDGLHLEAAHGRQGRRKARVRGGGPADDADCADAGRPPSARGRGRYSTSFPARERFPPTSPRRRA